MTELTHLNSQGQANMVDVSAKPATVREAKAVGYVAMQSETLAMIGQGQHAKGDVFAVARIAGIQGAKKCAELIPLCHLLMLSKVEVQLTPEPEHNRVRIDSHCKLTGQTGVEMEALTAVTCAALTLYDMCKAVDKHMVIQGVQVISKQGGKSGDWQLADTATIIGSDVE